VDRLKSKDEIKGWLSPLLFGLGGDEVDLKGDPIPKDEDEEKPRV